MTKSARFRCLRAVGLPLLAVGMLSMLVAGCGSSGEGKLTQDQRDEINNYVQNAADYYDNDKCDLADGAVADAQEATDNLDVDPEIKDGLDQLLSNLDGLETNCVQAETTAETTSSSSTETLTTETSSTEEADTDSSTTKSTTPPDTSTTASIPPTTTPPEPPPSTTPPDDGGVGGGDTGGGVGGTAPRKTHKHKPGKGPKNGKVPPGQAKKHEKKSKESKTKSGGVTP